ncbi:glycosyltransferase [uncultured Nocardioides sp.]|uniref:glycosyltransferase n=1 Tax=uncultured Nocardioides sp. TaxID=198441 RepID=UPI0026357AFB|nr:glycosyltransferase [uncultured Nocardioides sp.]
MIGYYVHHHGQGHLHRARVLAEELATGPEPEAVTVLTSLTRPDDETLPWLGLPYDADPATAARPDDPTARGTLHWAPLGHAGLRQRMAALSAWLEHARPRLVVSDVSQEVTMLCRLHGVPVVSVVLPGRRSDPAHLLGLRASSALVGFWPPAATHPLPGVPADVADRVVALGGLSRFAPVPGRPPAATARRVVVLGGRGGDAWTTAQVEALRAALLPTGREVVVLGPGRTWVEDPWPLLVGADVVLTHGGQNAVAEVAAARVPAVVVPAERPFEEQAVSARALDGGEWPAVMLDSLDHPDWPGLLDHVAALDGRRWAEWCDGDAAARFAAVVGDLTRYDTPLGGAA